MECIKFRALTIIIINIVLMIITFSIDNPVIISTVLICSLILLMKCKKYRNIIKGIKLFVPIAIITGIVNLIFVDAGSHLLFTLFNKRFTLETIIYAVIMSLKILDVIYLFYCLDCTLDTDEAVSYFSSISPKITLIILLCLKLVPNMKRRIKSLEEVYITRGVNFNSQSKSDRIKANIPILSILLSDSLENAFDIGESAYVRGFLSGKRTRYDRKKIRFIDVILIIFSVVLLIFHIVNIMRGNVIYDVYATNSSILNCYVIIEASMIIILTVFLVINFVKENEYELY